MTGFNLKNWPKRFLIFILFLTNSIKVFASTTSSLQFVASLTTLQNAICGPVLTSCSCILIPITCLMLGFGEWGTGFKVLLNIVLWLSIAFSTVSLVSTMWGTGAVF